MRQLAKPGMCRRLRQLRLKEKSDGLQIRGRQLAALADDLVAHLLPFIEGAHAGALDCGNVDEHVLSALGRLDETEALLRMKNLTVPVAMTASIENAEWRPRVGRTFAALRPNSTLSWEDPWSG